MGILSERYGGRIFCKSQLTDESLKVGNDRRSKKMIIVCPTCDGKTKTEESECKTCDGTGWVKVAEHEAMCWLMHKSAKERFDGKAKGEAETHG